MSLRLDPTDPLQMSPEARRDERAVILARGVLRLHGRVSAARPCSEIPEVCWPAPLEPSPAACPDGVGG